MGRRMIAGFLCLALAACASVRPAQDISVDYNRAFADSRDEILLLNILRAAGREPLQFSTMGNVAGSATRGQVSLTLPFNNIIAGGGADPFGISPSLGLTDTNPTLSIIPLSSDEFTRGLLRPTSPQTLNLFLSQGWDAEFLLTMAVGSVRCQAGSRRAGQRIDSSGNFTHPDYPSFQSMFADAASHLSIDPVDSTDPAKLWVLVLPGEDAATLLREGPGAGRRIRSITTQADGKARVEIVATAWTISGIDLSHVCGPGGPAATAAEPSVAIFEANTAPPTSESGNSAIYLRSVEAMIYFLGESHRRRMPAEFDRCRREASPDAARTEVPTYSSGGRTSELLRINLSCGQFGTPLHSAVATNLNGRHYYIDALRGPTDPDRSLKTLSFLSALIALQTSATLIENSAPILAIQR